MQRDKLILQKGQLSYLKFGTGSSLLIALHGHGDSARTFAPLRKVLGTAYTVCAVDLPFHGESRWDADFFEKKDIQAIVNMLCARYQKDRFALMGFSFGVRAILASLPLYQQQVERLYCIAPDGIDTPSLRKIFWTPKWLRKLLHRALQQPNWILKPTAFLHKIGFLSKYNYTFMENNLARPHRIQRAFGMWHSIDDFKTNNQQSIRTINEANLSVFVFSAKDDPFVRYATLEKMAANIPTMQLFPISKGHWIIGDALCAKLAKVVEEGLQRGKEG